MVLKKAFLFVSAVFLVVIAFCTNKAFAQRNSSLYFSAGYGTEWYTKQNVHIEQGDLGNSYEMVKVPGDNKTHTPLSILQFHYRIGYYTGHYQLWGIEANFDPANYRITDGKSITVKGTVNNSTVPNGTKVVFSSKDGYYYRFTGTNLFLLNLVRRFDIYHANSNKIRLDGIAKAGAGPVMPHFTNSLPINPVADPLLQFGGWNAGVEGGFRVTVYRHIYVEVTGKYDYASFNALKIYDGTARQNLNTFEVIGCLGYTFSTSRRNPLFRNERIITILPFYQQAKLAREGQTDEADKNSKDTTDHNMFREIPPFNDILDKEAQEAADKYARLHPPDTFTNADSIAHVDSVMRTDSITHADSILTQDSINHITDSLESIKPKKHRRHKKDQDTTTTNAALAPALDSMGNPIAVPPAATPPADGAAPPADTTSAPLSKKEIKRQQKAAEKAAKEKEQEELDKAKQEKEAADKAAKEKEAAANAAATPPSVADTTGSAAPAPDKKEEKAIAKEEKKEAKRKEKEAKEKAKEEERAAKEKAKQEEAAAKEKAKQNEEEAKKKADQEKADKDKQQEPPPPADNK